MSDWPKGPTMWQSDGVLNISVPFTWVLPSVRAHVTQGDFWRDQVRVGGPALRLMPDYFADLPWVLVGRGSPGVLQRCNPGATRTTIGCPNRCGFCAVQRIEGDFRELPDWPDLPIICDNNLFAASVAHFDRVCDRLERHAGVDFNQGLDARLLTAHHAERLARLKDAIVRLALDHASLTRQWDAAFDLLRSAGVAKARIRTYVLCGYRSDPQDAWRRCEHVEATGTKALPQWYHPLDAMAYNAVLPCHQERGWNHKERDRIMHYYYQHRGSKPEGMA